MKIYPLFFVLFMLSHTIIAQNEESLAGQTKTIEANKLPTFRFFTATDSTLVTSSMLDQKKKVLFFYFSTKCPYCQEMTGEILQKLEMLRDVQIVMVSGHRRASIIKYMDALGLKNKPIMVLKDDEKKMHSYFDYSAVPMIRMYDTQGKLIHRQEGRMTVSQIRDIFDKK